MQLHKYRFKPVVGLLALFLLYVLAAVILSAVYRVWMARMENVALLIAGPGLFGLLLGAAVFGLKRFFKVVLDIPAFLVVLLGCALVYVLMWDGVPLRGVEEVLVIGELELPEIAGQTLTVGNWELPGIVSQIIAWLEALVIVFPPLYAAFKRAGYYLRKYNRWADVRLLEYGFVCFTTRELDRLSGGDVNIIADKTVDLTGLNRIHAIALCYVNNRATEYLAVFNAVWDRRGNIEKGALLLLVMLTTEKIDNLLDVLHERHRETELS